MRIRLSAPPDEGDAMTSEEAGCEPEREASPCQVRFASRADSGPEQHEE